MGAGKKLSGRLLAHHIALPAAVAGCRQQKGRIGLPAFELTHLQRPAEPLDGVPAIGFKPLCVEAMSLAYRGGFVLRTRGALGHLHLPGNSVMEET